MNEVVHNLWVGDLPSALDTEKLKGHKIRSVLTAMRGRVSIHEVCLNVDAQRVCTGHLTSQTLVRHQINIDDTDSSDILQHFVPAVTFIQAELDKDHGVLVHCQAGISEFRPLVFG